MNDWDDDQSPQVASVPKHLATCRLDRAASLLFPDYSRSLLSLWIREGRLTLDGNHALAKRKVVEGEVLKLTPDQARIDGEEAAEAMPLRIVCEDEDILVLDKPAGLVVHPGAGIREGTLMNGLLHHRPALRRLPRAGLVHRLDADTSGLLVVAASSRAHKTLVEDIAARRVGREYQALVEGRMISGGDFDAPIGRHPRRRTQQAVRSDGRDALTSVRVLERYRSHSRISARLHTGRTHQIRVHLSHAGFPLVGDRKYGARGILSNSQSPRLHAAIQNCARHMLHAEKLSFTHPVQEVPLEFSSSLPPDMKEFVEALKRDAA